VILQTELAYPPGESYLYSDVGLILLGHALTRCTGDVTLADTIFNWVTGPLALEAQFSPSCLLVDRIAPTEFCPWRQRRLHGEVHDENAAGLGGIAGHSGMFGTAADLCKLGNLYLAHGYLVDAGRLLARRTVDESISVQVEAEEAGAPLHATPIPVGPSGGALTLPPAIRRGLGWMLRSDPDPACSTEFGPDSFGHTGFTGTSLWCDPERELVVALLTNRVYHGRNPEPITRLRPAVHAAVVAGLRR
jgi:CubicO group peptidase (beta-lactamase class C family)